MSAQAKKKSVTSLLNSLSVTLEKKLSTEKLPFEATFFEATFSTEIDIFWHPKSQSRSTFWAPFGDQSWRGCLSKGTVLEKRYIEFSQSFLILELTPNDFVIIRAFLSFESIVRLLKKSSKDLDFFMLRFLDGILYKNMNIWHEMQGLEGKKTNKKVDFCCVHVTSISNI